MAMRTLDIESGSRGDREPLTTSSPKSGYISRTVSATAASSSRIAHACAGNLSRQLSDKLSQLSPRPVFFCGICLENVDQSECFSFSGCEHEFCVQCSTAYVHAQINDGHHAPPCPYFPMEGGCDALASEADVRFLIKDEAVLSRFQRFQKMSERDDYRECPKCASLQLPTRNLVGRVRPKMVCSECELHFCFYHATQHEEDETCVDYMRRTVKNESISTSWIRSACKPCPSCKFPTEKNKGCNHMTCVRCKTDWCWLCGQNISKRVTNMDHDYHYDPRNLRGCPGSQFTHGNGDYLCLQKMTSYVWFLIFGVFFIGSALGWLTVIVGLGIICCCFCCFFGCGTWLNDSDWDRDLVGCCLLGPPAAASMVAVSILWIFLALVWGLIMAPVLLLATPIWATLICYGKCTIMDVVRLWGFCGIYLWNSLAAQFLIHAFLGEPM